MATVQAPVVHERTPPQMWVIFKGSQPDGREGAVSPLHSRRLIPPGSDLRGT